MSPVVSSGPRWRGTEPWRRPERTSWPQWRTGAANVKAFDAELDTLRGTICEMGGLAEAAIREAMEALVRRDHEAAGRVVRRDKKIDALETEIERAAVQIMAVRAPMADDLREVVAALIDCSEMELRHRMVA